MVEEAPARWVSVHDGDKPMPHFSSVLLIDMSSVHFSLVESHMWWCIESQYFYQSHLCHSCATLRFIDTVEDIYFLKNGKHTRKCRSDISHSLAL